MCALAGHVCGVINTRAHGTLTCFLFCDAGDGAFKSDQSLTGRL